MNETVIIVVCISSIAYVLGGMVVLLKKNWLHKNLVLLTALSAGLLLSIAILDLIPDSEKNMQNSSLYVMLGFVIMYFIQLGSKIHANTSIIKIQKNEPLEEERRTKQASAAGISIGMLLHNFFEGLSIGVSYTASVHLGIIVSVALILHKIPEGLSYSAAMVAMTGQRKKTAGYLIAQTVFAWIGAGSALILSGAEPMHPQIVSIPLSITAGLFLYLGGTSMLPVINKEHDRMIPVFFLGGIVLYFVLHTIAGILA